MYKNRVLEHTLKRAGRSKPVEGASVKKITLLCGQKFEVLCVYGEQMQTLWYT